MHRPNRRLNPADYAARRAARVVQARTPQVEPAPPTALEQAVEAAKMALGGFVFAVGMYWFLVALFGVGPDW